MVTHSSKPMEPAWRKKIQAGQLANRLMEHANGKNDMTSTQVKAAQILLDKVAPNLSSVDSRVDMRGNININWPLPKTKLDE